MPLHTLPKDVYKRQLVAQGKSNGGTFVWNGTDMNGKPVASGIYMVQTADQQGNKGTVCKIAIVR